MPPQGMHHVGKLYMTLARKYNRSGFTLQFQLTGVSTAIPAASYSTTITYTIVET